MGKKVDLKKLQLSRETVRGLTEKYLKKVHGGLPVTRSSGQAPCCGATCFNQ
jgi:hypothetical protein